jgi:hypothetical protein
MTNGRKSSAVSGVMRKIVSRLARAVCAERAVSLSICRVIVPTSSTFCGTEE